MSTGLSTNWRCISETARQKLGLNGHFRPTSNARNEAMFREATMFAGHLRTVEKDLAAWARDVDTTFSNLRGVMLSALPRVYEEGSTGAAVPSEPEPTLIGGDVQVERLTSAACEAKKRLDVEVAQPIRQWGAAYRTVSERLKRLESLRLELDSRRRTVAELQGKVERVRANLGTTRQKGEADMEATLRRMQHKEDKMARCAAAYGESEAALYNSLFTLIKDTSVLRDYAAAALLIVQEAFAAGYAAFEPPMMGGTMGGAGGQQMSAAAPVAAAAAPLQQQQAVPTAYQPAAPVPPMGSSAGGGNNSKYAAGKSPSAAAGNEAKAHGDQWYIPSDAAAANAY